MADHYNSYGGQQNTSYSQPQQLPPQPRPPMGSVTSGYFQNSPQNPQEEQQQPPGQHGGNAQVQQQRGWQDPSQGTPLGTPFQEQGQLSPQGYDMNTSSTGQIGGLAGQMGTLGIGGEVAAPPRAGKKKSRHAYHNLDQPAGSSQAFNGVPQDSTTPSQFLNQGGGPHQYPGQQITPAMNQFPASPDAGSMFVPGSRPQTGVLGGPGGPASMEVSTSTGVSAQGRVDPEQIPSVPKARDVAERYYLDNTYLTMNQHLPPPAAVPYRAYDQGNTSPKYARLTINDIPSSAESLASTQLPLGLVLQPLAPISPGEHPIPVLDFGETGPPRCRRCRTYINPFMTFRSGGNKLVCNMCTFPNDVPPEYFAPTDPSGVRVDRDQRPELRLGTVEFMVPKEYWAKEPVGLRYLFVIDVGQEALNRGFLEAFCDGVLAALYGNSPSDGGEEDPNSPEQRALPTGAKVGFVSFDKDVHFYNCNAGLEHPQMLVMPDIEDPFVPLGSDGLFVDPYESRSIITSLLTQLPQLFSNVKHPEPALLPTLTACMDSLASTGGKIICSLSALPTWGPGKLFMREDKNLHGIDTEKKLFQTEHQGWRKAASKMVENGIGVDFFLVAPSGAYMDVATIGHVSAVSGGELFYYSNFHAPRDNLKLSLDIKHNIIRETGYQALMKVRCSNGLQVQAYHGNFQQHTFGADLEFGTIDADKAIGVMFSYDGKLDPKLDAHFQCALLYTTTNGERRVRCTNTVAGVSEGPANCMRFIDQDAVVSMIAKEAATRMTERTLKDIRNAITEKTIDILAGHRKSYSSTHPPGQLVLPELLKEFAMYTLSLLKTRAFKAGMEPSDRRTHLMRLIRSATPTTLSLLLYPRIYSLHDLAAEAGYPDPSTGHLVTPSSLRASFARIQEGGAYLVSDGQITLLWLHSQVSPNLLEDLFGPEHTTLQSLPADLNALPVLETHLNAQVRNLLAYWGAASGRESAPPLQLARQGLDGAEYEFARLLVEDRNSEAQSYVDWLVHVHRGVQMELAGQRGKKERDTAEQEGTLAGLRAMGW